MTTAAELAATRVAAARAGCLGLLTDGDRGARGGARSTSGRFVRYIDYGVIAARIDVLYAFAARSLGEPRVEALVSDGVPAYVWPKDAREPWLDGGKRVFPRLLAGATGAQWAFNEQQL